MTEFIQLYYEDSQKVYTYPFARLVNTGRLTVFFENYWIEKLVPEAKTEKIAVCSWQLKLKLKTYIGMNRQFSEDVLNSDYDVLALTRNTKYHQTLAAAEAWHPGFLQTFDKILAKIGVTRPNEVKIPIYQNHHSSRTEIYQDYVKNYLSPAMDRIKNDHEINLLAMKDSKYAKPTVTAEYLQKQIGIPYYPLVPFLLERLFSVYVHNKRISVTHL